MYALLQKELRVGLLREGLSQKVMAWRADTDMLNVSDGVICGTTKNAYLPSLGKNPSLENVSGELYIHTLLKIILYL